MIENMKTKRKSKGKGDTNDWTWSEFANLVKYSKVNSFLHITIFSQWFFLFLFSPKHITTINLSDTCFLLNPFFPLLSFFFFEKQTSQVISSCYKKNAKLAQQQNWNFSFCFNLFSAFCFLKILWKHNRHVFLFFIIQ